MALTFYGYVAIHIGIGAAILIVTGLILALLAKYSHGVFAFFINRLLGVEIIYPSEKDNLEDVTIKIDGMPVKAKRKSPGGYLLWFIGTITFTVALMVLFEGCILSSAGVYLGDQCPADPVTCFASSDNASSAEVGTFQCVPGNTTTFPGGTDKAWCYGWIVTRQTVSTVINQIGICGGILAVSGTLFAFMFRSIDGGKWVTIFCLLLMLGSLSAIPIMIGIATIFHISFSVLAYLVVFETAMLFFTASVFKSDELDQKTESLTVKPAQIVPVSS